MPGKSNETLLLDMMQDVASIKTNVEILLLDREHARADRKGIYERLGMVGTLKDRVDRIEPIVDRLNDGYHRGAGMVWMLRFMFGLAAGGGGAILTWALTKLK